MKHSTDDQIAKYLNTYVVPQNLKIRKMIFPGQMDKNGEVLKGDFNYQQKNRFIKDKESQIERCIHKYSLYTNHIKPISNKYYKFFNFFSKRHSGHQNFLFKIFFSNNF